MADDNTLQRLQHLTRQGFKEHEQRISRYDTSYEVWRVKDNRSDGLPPWRSRIRVPYAQASIDTALVNVVSGIPRCLVKPRRPQDVLSARAMQSAMDYFTAEAHLAEPQVTFAQQGLIFGVTVAKNYWAYRENEKLIRQWVPDPFTGQMVEQVDTETLVVRDGPCFEPWSVYDCWWDPNARDVDSAQYIVLRSYMTKDQLLRKQYSEKENADGSITSQGLYKNLEKLFETGSSESRPITAQESFLGNTDFKRKEAFELWEIWEDDRISVIGNRQILLRSDPNPYWHGCKPIVIAQTRPDLFEMQGVAETELLRDIQAAEHTLQNMTIDHLHMSVMAGFTYRAGQVIDPNILQLRPNFRWPVTDHDDVRPVQMPQLDSNVYVERQRLLGDMERVTGVSSYLSGADSSTVDQTTATGVSTLAAATQGLMRFKARQLHEKGFQRTFEQWGEMIQQFMSDSLWTEVTGRDLIQKLKASGVQVEDGDTPEQGWWEVSPQEVVGHYRYNLEGTEESLSQQQARTEAIALLNAFTPLMVPGGPINPRAIAERVAMAFGIQDVDSLLTPPQQQVPPAAPNGQQLPAGQDPMTLMNGAQAPLPVQQAVGYGS